MFIVLTDVSSESQGLANWLNANQGFASAILTAIAVVISFWALFSSIRATKRQNKIALFDKKYEIYEKINILIACLEDYANGKNEINVLVTQLVYFKEGYRNPKEVGDSESVKIVHEYYLYYPKIDKLYSRKVGNKSIELFGFIMETQKMIIDSIGEFDDRAIVDKEEIKLKQHDFDILLYLMRKDFRLKKIKIEKRPKENEDLCISKKSTGNNSETRPEEQT
jgi:hypothetical protein